MDKIDIGLAVLSASAAGFALGTTIEFNWPSKHNAEQKRAIAAHVAHYEVNAETGETMFVYGCTRECCREEKK